MPSWSNTASRNFLRRLPALSFDAALRKMGSMSTSVASIEMTGCKSSVILISAISLAQSRHLRTTSWPSRPGMGERKVPWFSAASLGPVNACSDSTPGTKAPSSKVFRIRASLRKFFAAVGSACPSLYASQVTLCWRSNMGNRRWV